VDELAAYFELLGEPVILAGSHLAAIFNQAGQVELDGVIVVSTTAEVPATAAAAMGQTLVHCNTTYTVRQVLPQPPDAAIHLLVLAKA
jgi:hypothetical protein